MKLWNRAIGAIKDQNSIVVVYISIRNSLRNPDLQAALIKATSHDECRIDKRNARIVFSWIRASPSSIGHFLWALSNRMERTRSWVVAIKGLMLMHGVFHCKVPMVQRMKRLPFDLSSFSDRHSKPSETWGFNYVIRDYFAFLDRRAYIYSSEQDDNDNDDDNETDERLSMMRRLLRLEKRQSLIDLLLQIRPRAGNMKVGLILEFMDCVIIELFDAYSTICSEIAEVFMKTYPISKPEASVALKVLQKASKQGEVISLFIDFCREFGVLNANVFPEFTQIPKQGVEELERIMNGASVSVSVSVSDNKLGYQENKVMVTVEDKKGGLKTIITDKWVVFDEEDGFFFTEEHHHGGAENQPPLIAIDDDDVPSSVYKHHEIPDLISL